MVVVVGGMGSVLGAYLAALLIGELTAFGIWVFPEITLVLTFLIMAVVLVVRPYGLLGRPEAAQAAPGRAPAPPLESAGPRRPPRVARPRARTPPPAARGRRLRAVPADRDLLSRAVRPEPALHHGPGRHDLVRACRLFRARRLWRRPAGQASGGTDAPGAPRRPGHSRARRAAVRLVLRPPRRRLSRDALARLRPDRLRDRVPMVRPHRRRQRPHRHLALGLGELDAGFLLFRFRAQPYAP